jgi:hypothetical protein
MIKILLHHQELASLHHQELASIILSLNEVIIFFFRKGKKGINQSWAGHQDIMPQGHKVRVVLACAMLAGHLVVGKRLAIFFTDSSVLLPFIPAKAAVVHCAFGAMCLASIRAVPN